MVNVTNIYASTKPWRILWRLHEDILEVVRKAKKVRVGVNTGYSTLHFVGGLSSLRGRVCFRLDGAPGAL
jgi:hypothetical protein